MLPVILLGWVGVGFTIIANVRGVLLPQVLFAVTIIVPEVLPMVALIEFVVETPVQPLGKVHV